MGEDNYRCRLGLLGPLLFNILLNDLFLFVSNASLSNYADDNTLYTFGDNLKKNKDNLRSSFDTVHQWFYENYMVLNAGKCHFMCLGNNTENETFLFHNILMENSKKQKILGVIIVLWYWCSAQEHRTTWLTKYMKGHLELYWMTTQTILTYC